MLKEYAKRIAICVSGLLLLSVSNMLGVKAGMAGTNAWNTLSLGMSDSMGISFGTATLLVSLAIVIIDLLGKGKLGIGTILNIVLISVFSDICLKIFEFMPQASGLIQGVCYTLLGQILNSFATVLYMWPGLGAGPRDTLMIIIGRKFPRAPIGMVKLGLELMALLAGFMLGAPVGVGTLLILLLQTSMLQFACRVTHCEPRAVSHEDLVDTCRRIFNRTKIGT